MRLSLTLSTYIGRQLLIGIGMAFFTLIVLILVFDSVELTRRAAGNEDATMRARQKGASKRLSKSPNRGKRNPSNSAPRPL